MLYYLLLLLDPADGPRAGAAARHGPLRDGGRRGHGGRCRATRQARPAAGAVCGGRGAGVAADPLTNEMKI